MAYDIEDFAQADILVDSTSRRLIVGGDEGRAIDLFRASSIPLIES